MKMLAPTICPYLLPDIAPALARDYPGHGDQNSGRQV
jgi:hypothetical protein